MVWIHIECKPKNKDKKEVDNVLAEVVELIEVKLRLFVITVARQVTSQEIVII